MPLDKSGSKKSVGINIKELYDANKSKPENKKRSPEQIAAIAYAVQKEAKKK